MSILWRINLSRVYNIKHYPHIAVNKEWRTPPNLVQINYHKWRLLPRSSIYWQVPRMINLAVCPKLIRVNIQNLMKIKIIRIGLPTSSIGGGFQITSLISNPNPVFRKSHAPVLESWTCIRDKLLLTTFPRKDNLCQMLLCQHYNRA